jgi:hypothetical protein
MKKIIFLFCFIFLFACSKSEDIPLIPDNIEVSHITNDDLALVDGFIQLKINKEEAIMRGVPASEYGLVKEALIKHNEGTTELLKKQGKERVQTKSDRYGNTMAYGMLQDPADLHFNYISFIPLCVANEESAGGIVLSCTFASYSISDLDRHVLKYHIVGPGGGTGEIEEYGYTIEDYPFPGFTFGSVALEYNYDGYSLYGICIYQIYDNT